MALPKSLAKTDHFYSPGRTKKQQSKNKNLKTF